MSDFNFDAFRPVIPVADTDAKRSSVSAASAAKQALLASAKAEREAAQAQADYERSNSWAGKLGLEEGSFLSNRVNDAASLVSGASRVVGDVATLPINAFAALNTLGATSEDYNAVARVKAGSTDSYDLHVAQPFMTAEKARNIASDVRDTFDLKGIVDQSNRNALTADLGDEFEANWTKVTAGWDKGKPSDVVSGLAGLLLNAGEAVVTNPSASREYIIENVPQLLGGTIKGVGKGLLLASNAGYAADTYREGLEKYAVENDGALPPEAERTRMALYAASLAAAEQVGDVVSLGVAKVAGRAAKDVAETGVLASVKNTSKAAASAGVTEAATEGYQTFAEGEVKGTPATAQDIYTGAVIGAVAGAGLAGGGRAIAEATKPSTQAQTQQDAASEAAVDAAVKAETPDAFLDPRSPDYDPAKAVTVLAEMSKKADTTPEQIQENIKQTGSIVSQLEAEKEKLEEKTKQAPTMAKELETELSELQAERATIPEDEVDFIAYIDESIASINTQLEDLVGDDRILQRNNRLATITRQLEEARTNHQGLVSMAQPTMPKAEINNTIRSANSDDVAVSSKAGDVLLNLSMAAPDSLDHTTIASLVNNKKNGLTAPQRDLLRKFSDARSAELEVKKQSEVSQEILFGSANNIGIAQYRTRIAAAMASQSRESADRDLKLMSNFAASHNAKLEAIAEADVGDQIVREGEAWVVNTGKRLSDKERRANGAVNITPASGKLIKEIRNEAKALTAALDQMTAAVALHFEKGAVQSIPLPTPKSNSMEKSIEVGTRLNDKPVQTVGEQKKNTQEVKSKSTTQSPKPSPQSQPASPIAVAGAPAQATVAQSVQADNTQVQDFIKVLDNPPDGYTTARTREMLASATEIGKRIKKELDAYTEVDEQQAMLEDTLALARIFVKNAKASIEADTKLANTTEQTKKQPTKDNPFPDSVVKGVAYHSTNDDPATFVINTERDAPEFGGWMGAKGKVDKRIGFYTTKNKSYSESFGSNTMEYYVNLQNPYLAKDGDGIEPTQITVEQRDNLIAQGYDGVLYDDPKFRFEEIVVFNADQVIRKEAQPEATQQQAVVSEANPATVAEVATAEETPITKTNGSLSVLKSRMNPEDMSTHDMFRSAEFNPIAQFFKQKAASDFQTTARPLVQEENFLTEWRKGNVLPAEFLGFQPDESQKKVLKHFASMARKWNDTIKTQLVGYSTKEGDQEFKTRDMMQYMIKSDGTNVDIDENILTGMSYGMYHWFLSAAQSPLTEEKLNQMHGRDADAPFKRAQVYELLSGVTNIESTSVSDLGDMALQGMGLVPTKDAPQDLLPRLKTALGTHMIIALEANKLVERRPINVAKINSYFADIEEKITNPNAEMMYIFPNVDAMNAFKDINKGTGAVLDKMFGAENAARMADTKPSKFVQEFAQHTQQRIPAALSKALNAAQKVPHKLIPDMMEVMNGIGREGILKAAGFRDPNDNVHVANIKGVEAKNDGLVKQLDLLLEAKPDQEYFVKHEVWKNFRVGVTTDSLNQQTSKIHRYMFARPNWTVTIDMNNVEHRNAMEVAIAAGLGIKTDDQSNEETMEMLRDKWNKDADLRTAVESIHLGLTTGKWENADVIADYAAGNEGMMTLQTLVAYAKYQYADASGKFDVTLLAGADGKTNGPILTHLALGAASSETDLLERMARGGMYTADDNAPKHYSQWRKEQSGKDLYQDLASTLLSNIERSPLLDAIEVVTGKLQDAEGNVAKGGRDLVKTPLTAFAFGSSMGGSIEAMQNKFIEGIYTKIEKMAAKNEDATSFINALNTLTISQMGGEGIPRNISAKKLLENELDPLVEQALRDAFNEVMKKPVTDTMKTYFATFIARRSDLNSTIQAGFAMYATAYKAAREQAIQNMIASGDIAHRIQRTGADTGKKVPMHDLSVEQENTIRAEIVDLLPVAHTAYSMGGKLEEGIYMGKQESSLSQDSMYQSVVNFANRVMVPEKGGTLRNRLSIKAMIRSEINPGVAGTPYFIHSLDSALMHTALNSIAESLNVHDEIGNSVLGIARAAGAINKATIDKMVDFSPAREALGMLERIAAGMAKGIKDNTVSQDTAAQMVAEWRAIVKRRYPELADKETKVHPADTYSPNKIMHMVLDMALDNAVQADRVRLNTIAQLGAVDQYVWEGGHYEVPVVIREKAKTLLANMVTELKPETKEAFNTINAFLAGKTLPDAVIQMESPDPVPTLEVRGADMAALVDAVGKDVEAVTRAADKLDGYGLNPWGEVGPSDMVESNIVNEFKGKLTMNRNEIVHLMGKTFKSGPMFALLGEISKKLPDNLVVEVVTPDTPVDRVLEMPLTKSRGWFVPTKSKSNVIYLLSADFRYSGLNAETIMHELTHAALAREIHEPSSKASQSLVSDLTALMEHIKAQPGANEFKTATTDVHELVSWGMTNAKFQEFLKGIEYKSKTKRNRLVTAMKEFVSTLSGLLFGTGNDTKDRALTALIQNTAGLFEAASSSRKSTLGKVLSQATPVQDYTTTDIYEALGENANNPLSQEDDVRLRSLMATLVSTLSPLYGAFSKDAMTNQSLSAASIYANAVAGGTAPFALDATANGLASNEQVAFMMEQVEVTMRAALSGTDGVSSVAYKEIQKVYKEAAEALKGKLPDTEYDFIFNPTSNADGSSNYLSRFAAIALVNPKINGLMKFQTSRVATPDADTSMLARLQRAFEMVMEWVVGRWTKTYAGQNADSKLSALATQLVMIEAKRRARLNVQQSKTLESVEEAFRGMAESTRDKVDDIAKSAFFKDSKSGFVRLAGTMTSIIAKDRLDQLGLAYQDFSDKYYTRSQGVMASLVNEIRGANEGNTVFYKLLRISKFLEGQRKDLITGTSKIALNSFANDGKDLTDPIKKSLSNVVLRTDMAALLGPYDLKGLNNLLADKAVLAKALVTTTEQLATSKHQLYYINAAKALGYQMATGRATTSNNMLNAMNIARLYGTAQTIRPEVAAQFEPIIDQLASLYAISYTNAADIDATHKVFSAELAREKGNGIEMMLKLHKQLQDDSKKRLFEGQETLMMKGYTPEIYNPYIEMRVVDQDEVAELKEEGFGEGYKLSTAFGDPENTQKVLMARHGSGLQQYQTGTMSLTAMKASGTTKHNGVTDLFSKQGQYNVSLMGTINKTVQSNIAAMFTQPIDPTKVEDTFMVPVLNPQGEKVNYRYMMESHTKDNVLDRDNRFEKLLGVMAGSIYDKQASPKQNHAVIEALHEQYKLDGVKRANSFIDVGPRSPDPEMREIYRLLPQATKDAIAEVWKSDTMRVRIDLLDITFGYRKLSMTDLLKNDRDVRTGFNKLMGDIVSTVFGAKILSPHADEDEFRIRDAKATTRIRNFEEIWQTVVREAKDIIVIKSFSTLIGNMSSNFTLLYGYGVPMADVLRSHRIAFRGAVAYKRDSDELFTVQTKLDTGTSSSVNEDKKRVVELKNALARNPVRELIEAGLMPTIVDDVELDDDIYSFKSKFVKRMEGMADSVNPGVKAVAKQLYMTHDTTVYKALSQAAQLSDFLGRYTLYTHMTTKKRDPMTKEAAIQLASDAFISYDVPTHRKMQYMNDMGFFRFTKYYLRVQKVIAHLYRENPGRMISLMGLTSYFDQVPTLLDSAMISRFGNPLEVGAFTYVDAPENLATMKILSSPFH